MSTETPTSAPPATITVTVMDAATIFEGPETVYRYDLAGTGIVEGKALGHVMDQIAKIAGSVWPDVDVFVIADPSGTAISREAVTILTRQLDVAGARVQQQDVSHALESTPARSTESVAGAPESVPTDQMDVPMERAEAAPEAGAEAGAGTGTGARAGKGQEAGTRWGDKLRGWIGAIDMFHVAIVVVILAVVGASWWAMSANASDDEDDSDAGATAGSATAASVADSVPAEETGGGGSDGSDGDDGAAGDAGGDGELNPGEKRLDIEGLSVVLPTGFQATVEEGLVTASGKDPDLRILLASDSLFNVPAEALFDEIKAQVDKDPELRDVSEDAGRLHYIEDPGDGSVVEWTIWEETGHHMSVGCHTRHNANAVQKAACRMATESLSKK
ncbi:type VII secretion-associated protein [Corynebacterium sp. KPL2850]|uniref:type VII secretion-associated protein n=1 Tax=Corynebacterium sp. KPL2850 TaxID=3158318 RepID=UPI0032EE2A10